mmetsp:Transcript_4102/g.7870  ORF Transcript_4102/g.7870 Transcript_4102/m.7870 type:complete len:84 (+) Transcript_4102:113-364(+)
MIPRENISSKGICVSFDKVDNSNGYYQCKGCQNHENEASHNMSSNSSSEALEKSLGRRRSLSFFLSSSRMSFKWDWTFPRENE